jgi:glucose-1-phosphate cytidylyltransferase
MKAVILAGGLGSRLSEETDLIPKPMVEIGGRPILWHIMKIYSQHGINDFVICLGYKGYVIKEYFQNYHIYSNDVTFDFKTGAVEIHQNAAEPWRVTLVDTGPVTQTGGRLKRVGRYLNETFCLTYGDGVGDVDIAGAIAFHRNHGRLATVTAVIPPGRFGVLHLDGQQVTSFGEKMDNRRAPINAGFFVLEPEVLETIDDDATPWEQEPLESLAMRGELMAWQHNGFWQPMDTLRDKRMLEDLWSKGAAPWKTWA